MTLHFIHIGKTGGTALKRGLRRSGYAYRHPWQAAEVHDTPYGKVWLHNHPFKFAHLPEGDFAFFCLRDPIQRFMSGFYSRLTEGRPRYHYPWSEGERQAFTRFPTPQALAAALAGEDPEGRRAAEWAIDQIVHLGPMYKKLVLPRNLEARMDRIAYIARQETLAQDWENLKDLLGMPASAGLPTGARAANRGPEMDRTLDRPARKALRRYYRKDYKLLRIAEEIRYARGWTTTPPPPRRQRQPKPTGTS